LPLLLLRMLLKLWGELIYDQRLIATTFTELDFVICLRSHASSRGEEDNIGDAIYDVPYLPQFFNKYSE